MAASERVNSDEVADVELNPGPKMDNSCVIGISVALLQMIFPSYVYWKPITLTICTTLIVSRKDT